MRRRRKGGAQCGFTRGRGVRRALRTPLWYFGSCPARPVHRDRHGRSFCGYHPADVEAPRLNRRPRCVWCVRGYAGVGSPEPPASPQQAAVNRTSQHAEILRHFRALVQIDTSNPPGNEVKVVEYLEKVLAAEGIPSTRFALDPNRPNLVARLKGNGSKRPVLLLAHTDVVGVQRDKWPVDPFGGILRDGYVWGRGTTDDKDNLTANLMAFLLIKRSGEPLDRDLIFLAESGEEADPTGVGVRFMVDRHFDAIDAEFAIAEGNGATIDDGRVRTVQISTTEKVPRRIRLIATGTSGHGSVPAPRQCGHPPGQSCREGGQLGDADAPQRDDAAVLREARVDQHARAGGAIPEPARSATLRRCRALPCRARTCPLFRAANVARADDAAGGNWPERDSFHGGSGDRHSDPARRRPPGSHRRDVRSHRRPRGQDRAVANHASGRATVPDRLIDVPGARAGRRSASIQARRCSRA